MGVYTFGGNPVQAANVNYTSYTLTTADSPLQLNWPQTYLDTDKVAALITNLNPTDPSLQVILPNATEVSVGQTLIFNNVGSESILISSHGDIPSYNYILVAGTAVEIYLIDSSTVSGTWNMITLSQTTSVNAAALAGYGLTPLPSPVSPFPLVLNTDMPTTDKTTDFNIDETYRASLVSTDQVITITLPVPMLPNGFYFVFTNQGALGCPINAGAGTTINGLSTFSVNGNSTVTVVSDGVSNWKAINYTPQISSVGGVLEIPVTGGTIDLTASQIQYNTLVFTGILASDQLVTFFPSDSSWIVVNATTGSFDLNVQMNDGMPVPTPVGNPVPINQDSSLMFYGVTTGPIGPQLFTVPTLTAITGGFIDGDAANPSIKFISATDTGFYLDTVDPPSIGVAVDGMERCVFGKTATTFSTNLTVTGPNTITAPTFAAADGIVTAPSYTFTNSLGGGMWLNGNAVVISSLGVQSASFSNTAVTLGSPTIASFSNTAVTLTVPTLGINGTSGAPSYSFDSSPTTGMYFNGTSIVFSVSGSNILAMNSANIFPQGPIRGINGTSGAPSYTFDSAPTTGMYFNGTSIGFSVSGSNILAMNSTNISSLVPTLGINGTSGAPSYSFISSPTTGMSWTSSGSGLLRLSNAGTSVLGLAPYASSSTNPLTTNNGGLGSATITPTQGYIPVATGTASGSGTQTSWVKGVINCVSVNDATTSTGVSSISLNQTYTKILSGTNLLVSFTLNFGAITPISSILSSYSLDSSPYVILNASMNITASYSFVNTYSSQFVITGESAGSHTLEILVSAGAGNNILYKNRSELVLNPCLSNLTITEIAV